MDLNIPQRVPLFVDLLLFPLRLLTVMPMPRVERLSFHPGRKKISAPVERDGGTKYDANGYG